jgi:hypothetical protein
LGHKDICILNGQYKIRVGTPAITNGHRGQEQRQMT